MGQHRVFFDYDPLIQRTVWLVMDDHGNMVGAHVEQEVDPIIAANAEAEKATHGVRFNEWNRAASVPLTFLEKTGLDVAVDMGDRKFISKVLNDADHAKFRTSRGKV